MSNILTKACMRSNFHLLRKLKSNSRLVLTYLCTFAYQESETLIHNKTYPSYGMMCDALNISRPTAIKAIKELTEFGFLIVKKGQSETGNWQHNTYYLNVNLILKGSKDF